MSYTACQIDREIDKIYYNRFKIDRQIDRWIGCDVEGWRGAPLQSY